MPLSLTENNQDAPRKVLFEEGEVLSMLGGGAAKNPVFADAQKRVKPSLFPKMTEVGEPTIISTRHPIVHFHAFALDRSSSPGGKTNELAHGVLYWGHSCIEFVEFE